ncbi:suppressor of mec-8 and unc-52 protein homolog 2-like [Miscanthus floridulus]|uniref:suppressor of mec-8 and unc-52 protein homolog 2-like n=1 Tax=Miscanthus floridulus TaxID=154761 RepID=UPI0034589632
MATLRNRAAGDLENTHLVKGLEYALLHKVRSEIEKKPDAEDVKDAKSCWYAMQTGYEETPWGNAKDEIDKWLAEMT